MRWIVEVSSIGKTDKQAYCVESDSWQRALQAARSLRSDNGPMTGFSIELLDEGFSAVDPMSRMRYFVKRAPDDAPLSKPGPSAAAPAVALATTDESTTVPKPVAPIASPAAPPRPASMPPAAAAAAPAAGAKGKKALHKTVAFSSQGSANLVPDAATTSRDVGDTQQSAAAAPSSTASSAVAPKKAVAPQAPRPAASVGAPSPAKVPVAPQALHVPAPQAAAAVSPAAPAAVSPPQGVQAAVPPATVHVPQAPGNAPPAASTAPQAAPAPAPAPIVSPPTLPGVEVLFKREQEPDNRSPLTYREYAYFFAAGSEEVMAKAMLVAQFELVKGTIQNAKPGKLVNLAMFDVSFKGKPPVMPVVTLSWKDWKGEPVIDFPRRNKPNGPSAAKQAVAPAAAQRQPVSQAPAPVVPQPQTPQYVAQPAPQAAPQYVPQIPPQFVPQPAAAPAPQAAAVAPPAPVFASQPAFPPQQAFPPPAMFPVPAPAGHSTQPSAGVLVPQPAPVGPPPDFAAPTPGPPPGVSSYTPAHGVRRASSRPHLGGRLRGDELIADLFEAMHDLHFLRDAVEGGDFCLALALEKMPSRAGIVHLYDIDRREFLVTSTMGAGTQALLLRRHPESDPLLSAAMRKQRGIVIADAAASEAASLDRYRVVGSVKSLVIAPVILAGRFLGAIELLDPTDGQPFKDDEGHALTYIGEQFAEFVATRGVVLDPERIANRQQVAPQGMR